MIDQHLRENPPLSVTIDFTPLSLSIWAEWFNLVPYSNILQSYDYARFISGTSPLRPRWGLIYAKNQPVGLIQIFVLELAAGMISRVILDRGPLWFSPDPDPIHVRGFFAEFARLYPRRFGRRRRILPEVPEGMISEDEWHTMGYRRRMDIEPYQTCWIDLLHHPETLRARLSKKWRYDLRRAEGMDLQGPVFSGFLGDTLPVLGQAAQDQRTRGYGGLDGKSLFQLLKLCSTGEGAVTGIVKDQKENIVAGAIFIRHGLSATYQTGFVSPDGRSAGANHLLLWQSLLYLQDQGVKTLDLGGLNDGDARGIAHFKKGLGGQHATFVGQYS